MTNTQRPIAMIRRRMWTAACAALAPAALSLACAGDRPASAQPSQPAAASTTDGDLPEVLATVGDQKITMAEVRTRVGDDLDQMDARYRRARHKLIETALDQLVRDRMLQAEAKKQGKSVEQLVLAETGGSLEPSDSAIAAWYRENRSRTQGRPLEQIRDQIAELLRSERRKQASDKLEQRLSEAQRVKINLPPYRVTLDNNGAASKGPANAAVTLVEFSDFQCPYCGKFFPTLKRLEENYGSKIKIVYRNYPLTTLHPFAFKAAEAGLCAQDQGKFWEMHDAMFEDQTRLAVKDLKATAGRLGLDQKAFNTCLDTGRHTERVQDDMLEGGRAGVTGTPALFVNGMPLEGGALPYEAVAAAIDKELASAGH